VTKGEKNPEQTAPSGERRQAGPTRGNPDAIYHNHGGSSFWLRPENEETYRKLLDADAGMAPGGRNERTGYYPTMDFNAPTSTNTVHNPQLREKYRRIMTALQDSDIREAFPSTGGSPAYPIGDPEAVWP
jgi:hypothetical protein